MLKKLGALRVVENCDCKVYQRLMHVSGVMFDAQVMNKSSSVRYLKQQANEHTFAPFSISKDNHIYFSQSSESSSETPGLQTWTRVWY